MPRFPWIPLVAAAVPALLAAQNPPPQAPPGEDPLVYVTPDNVNTAQRTAGTTGYVEVFWVRNIGGVSDTYSITCAGSSNVTCTGTSRTVLPLAPGTGDSVLAYYNVGSAGTGKLKLTAAGAASDSGWYNVIVVGVPSAPVVTLKNHNGDNRDRSMCLTSGAGEAAAWQCGDLLVAHGLPGYATMGRERSLTLLYNSAQAVPRAVVAATVNEAGIAAPTSVKVRLDVNGDSVVATYNSWNSGSPTRQVVVALDVSIDSTGLYPFTLRVGNQYPGYYETSISDTLLVVNRSRSLFGAGWSLAGVEELRLNQPGNKILWVGGDGSVKVYRSVTSTRWAAAAGAYRDTIVQFDSASVVWWRRTLRHGVSVTYQVVGSANQAKHVRTTNRIGQSSSFTWAGDTLKTITVPPGISGTTYTLMYAAGKLDKITDPAGRVLDATVVSSRLTQLVDPDSAYHTNFSYDASGRMIGRTSRRGFTNRYGYANGLRVTADSIRLDTASAIYGITTFTPWDEKGLATAPTGNTAVDTSVVYSKIDGPRPTSVGDTAEFWVDRWGAPIRSRDPLGNVTTTARGDANNPALVTRAQLADGRVLAAWYNARANIDSTADSTYEGTGTTQRVTTSYVYADNTAPDSPTKVRTPVDTTTIAYHDSLGLPDTITAQGGHKTVFAYFLTPSVKRGLLASVTDVSVHVVDTTAWTKSNQDLVTNFTYDAFGNDSIITSPKAAQTRYEYDGFRHVVRAYDPMNHVTAYAYDNLNHPLTATVLDPDSLKTSYFYSPSGALDSIGAPRHVKRSWRYDAADEPLSMTDDLGTTAQQYFGPSGLLDSVRTRTRQVIKHRYDAAGRLVATVYPGLYNNFGNFDHNYAVPGDSVLRTYDAVGRLLTVTQGKDTVTRTYNREGTVRTERQLSRASTGTLRSDFTVRYWYDAGGRRTKFFNGTDTLRYSYGADGLLAQLAVQWMNTSLAPDTFRFYWDGLGRRDSLVYVKPGVFVSLGYDRDGNLRMVCSRHPASSLGSNDYFEQRARYTALNPDGAVLDYERDVGVAASCASTNIFGSTTYQYDARHEMLRDGNNSYTYDSSGNRLTSRDGNVLVDSLLYTPGSNRLSKSFNSTGALDKTFQHDSNGSRRIEIPSCDLCNWRLYYYNSLGQQTGHKAYAIVNGPGGQYNMWVGGPMTCVYDPLGRRVSACDDGASGGGWAGFDGENVIRLTATTPLWRYVHGPGLDDPLVAMHESGGFQKHYYLTDGRGRHLAFTDSIGRNYEDDVAYFRDGGNQAGSIGASDGFANARAETPSAPQLSFYRNRYYDQQTGRFTQEDPIGIAGGVNLYAYSGNNPAAYTDPFGLCPDLCVTEIAIGMAIGSLVAVVSKMIHNVKSGENPDQGIAQAHLIGAVVGGIGGAMDAMAFNSGGPMSNESALEGTGVFRVFGGQSKGMGPSWTPINPGSVSDFRATAGLPTQNTGQFVAEGVLTNATGVALRAATSGAGGPGGLAEFLVPNAAMQIRLVRVSGANPPF